MTPAQNPANSTTASNQRFPLADNMDNITKIVRMWRAQWPEFSWLTVPGEPSSRCFQMFAPDISRVGYGNPLPNSNQCPVWAIMCPQQGIWIQAIEGTLNVEVTVLKAGGFVTENPMSIDAQLIIQPKIWFSPDTLQNSSLIKLLWQLFSSCGIPFPDTKAHAIALNTFGVSTTDTAEQTNILTVTDGMDPSYTPPAFAMHDTPDIYNQVAAKVVHLAVEIGDIISAGSTPLDAIANWFNELVMDIFNIASGNLLQKQNILSWNVWALAPEEVYSQDWQIHADYWRFSLDVNHRSPEGNGRSPQDAYGNAFNPLVADICTKLQELKAKLNSEKILASLPIMQDIEKELNAIIATNCSGAVVFQ